MITIFSRLIPGQQQPAVLQVSRADPEERPEVGGGSEAELRAGGPSATDGSSGDERQVCALYHRHQESRHDALPLLAA